MDNWANNLFMVDSQTGMVLLVCLWYWLVFALLACFSIVVRAIFPQITILLILLMFLIITDWAASLPADTLLETHAETMSQNTVPQTGLPKYKLPPLKEEYLEFKAIQQPYVPNQVINSAVNQILHHDKNIDSFEALINKYPTQVNEFCKQNGIAITDKKQAVAYLDALIKNKRA